MAIGETVELRSSGTLVGSVRLEGADGVVIEATFLSTEVRNLERGDFAPESMHAILDHAADPADVAKRREMGGFAEANGLLALAIADFAAARTLDPKTAKELDARIAAVEEQIAGEMLFDAQGVSCPRGSRRRRAPDRAFPRRRASRGAARNRRRAGSAEPPRRGP